MSNIAQELMQTNVGGNIANAFATIGSAIRQNRQSSEAKNIVQDLVNQNLSPSDILKPETALKIASVKAQLADLGPSGAASSKVLDDLFGNVLNSTQVQAMMQDKDLMRQEKQKSDMTQQFEAAVAPIKASIQSYEKDQGELPLATQQARATSIQAAIKKVQDQFGSTSFGKQLASGLVLTEPQDVSPSTKSKLDLQTAQIGNYKSESELRGAQIQLAKARAQSVKDLADITVKLKEAMLKGAPAVTLSHLANAQKIIKDQQAQSQLLYGDNPVAARADSIQLQNQLDMVNKLMEGAQSTDTNKVVKDPTIKTDTKGKHWQVQNGKWVQID